VVVNSEVYLDIAGEEVRGGVVLFLCHDPLF
jgi:hypothetical protein